MDIENNSLNDMLSGLIHYKPLIFKEELKAYINLELKSLSQ